MVSGISDYAKNFCIIRKFQHPVVYVVIQIIDVYQKSMDPSTEPYGTPLKTNFQPDLKP